MSNDPAKLIRSDDPRDRMKGIKIVARLQNERALRVLASLAEEDDDAEVRAFAKKGARYVAKKLEEHGALEIEVPQEEPEQTLPDGPVAVSEKDERRANDYVAAAFSMHLEGDNTKAAQELTRALKLNPNLREDQYFGGVASSVTGLEQAEAIKALASDRRRKGLADKEAQQKTEKALGDHMTEAGKYTWNKITIDIGVLAAIVFLGMLFTILMIPYAGNLAIDSQIQTAVEEAIEQEQSVNNVTYSEEEIEQRQIELIDEAQASRNVRERRDFLSLINFGVALLFATGAALSTVGSVIAYAVTSHLVIKAMKGEGKMPYTVYNILGAYPVPMMVLYGLLIAGIIIIAFLQIQSRFAPAVLDAIIALVMLVVTIRVGNRLRKSYFKLSFGQSTIAGLVASISSGIITILVYGLTFFLFITLNGTLWQLLQETVEAAS